jgi:hypothetical protein
LEGICPKCGLHFYGWSLNNPDRQKCGQCGGPLEIVRNGAIVQKEIAPPSSEESKSSKHLKVFTPSAWKTKKEEILVSKQSSVRASCVYEKHPSG